MPRYTQDVVNEINDTLYADSRIRVDPIELLRALEADMGANGSIPPDPSIPLPTPKEVDLLVTGGEDGDIPTDLIARYPRTNKLLNDQF